MKEYKCENGVTYNVPDKSCLVCQKCKDVFWDYTNGPYMVICSIHEDPVTDGTCTDYVEEEKKEFDFDDFMERIKEFQRQQLEEKDKLLAEVITKYDFMVGSKDLKESLEKILPEGAKVAYTPYIEDPTSVYLIKRFVIGSEEE